MNTRPSIISSAAFISAHVGKPYSYTDLHCWELVRRAQLEIFNRTLPAVIEHPRSKVGIAKLMARRDKHRGWRTVPAPEHGAVVFMTRRGHGAERAAIHSGVYLAVDTGGILHTDDPHGVVFDSVSEIKARNWVISSIHIPD